MKKKIGKNIIAFLCVLTLWSISILTAYAFPPSATPLYNGIDVSEWQGSIDFSQVKQAGTEVVYIRASVGADYTDSNLQENYAGAKAAGLKIGFYHYLLAQDVETAKAEAAYFVSAIQGMKDDCLLAMDYENFEGLGNDEINEIAVAFMEAVQEDSGRKVMLYSDAYDAGDVFGEDLAGYPLWIADYGVNTPYGNDIWSSWVGFQYSDAGTVNGIDGNVDLDYFTKDVFLSTDSTNSPSKPETSGNIVYYTVESGDTLSGIAAQYGVTVANLVAWNQIGNPDLIYVGQVLTIYTQSSTSQQISYYTVESGDTLSGIADQYGVTVANLVAWNQISDPDLIYVGQVLTIYTQSSSIDSQQVYTVESGDTLWTIANDYNTTVAQILALNSQITNPNFIYIGESIIIP